MTRGPEVGWSSTGRPPSAGTSTLGTRAMPQMRSWTIPSPASAFGAGHASRQRDGHAAERDFSVLRIQGGGDFWLSECVITRPPQRPTNRSDRSGGHSAQGATVIAAPGRDAAEGCETAANAEGDGVPHTAPNTCPRLSPCGSSPAHSAGEGRCGTSRGRGRGAPVPRRSPRPRRRRVAACTRARPIL